MGKAPSGKPERNFASGTIWTGDNLDILRGLNSETVDLIYLDPPFNSNRDYSAPIGSRAAGAAFKDAWTLDDLDTAWLGLIADRHPAMYRIIEAAGVSHGDSMKAYLCMMGVRLLEMRRVLAPTGSIYLHCDPTASHYLKLLMDAVFGADKFRNEIVWQRTPAKGLTSARFASNHDIILSYGGTDVATWNTQYVPYDDDYIKSHYGRQEPESGRRYQLDNMLNPNKDRPNLEYEFLGVTRVWRWTKERMHAAYEAGRVVQTDPGRPVRYKRYLDEMPGVPVADVWADIQPLNSQAKERVGYPTQKPLALLERIIKANSNPGDLVLDPFCGCATACVAADNLQREWVGIDISSKAVELVHMRLRATLGELYHAGMVTARNDIPQRTDIEAPIPYRLNKHVLFGQQEGLCAGCRSEFPFRAFEVDHVIPQSRGGTDHIDNLQLLCSSCNRIKGNRSMEYLVARLAEFRQTA